jgi:hypothetical protein
MKYLEPGSQSCALLLSECFEQRSAVKVMCKQLPVFLFFALAEIFVKAAVLWFVCLCYGLMKRPLYSHKDICLFSKVVAVMPVYRSWKVFKTFVCSAVRYMPTVFYYSVISCLSSKIWKAINKMEDSLLSVFKHIVMQRAEHRIFK